MADQQQGIVGRGTFTLHPKITALSATTATVVDCAYSTSELGLRSDRQAGPADHAAGERRGDLDAGAVGRDVEGLQADGDGREMRARLLIVSRRRWQSWRRCWLALGPAWAGDPDGQNSFANAQASGGQLTVQAGSHLLDAAVGFVVGDDRRTAIRRRASRTRTSPTAAPTRRDPRRTADHRRRWRDARRVGVPDVRWSGSY